MIHSHIERELGFDVGLKRSIGEDWSVSLRYNDNGYPIKWIFANVEEQSPFNMHDFIKQRNRWQKCILLNALYSPDFSFASRFTLFYHSFCVLMAPIGTFGIFCYIFNLVSWIMTGGNLTPYPIDM